MDDEAIDDAWTLSSYLGDADILLTKQRGSYNEAEGVLQSAAASIAVRGVLFGNSNPLSSRLSLVYKSFFHINVLRLMFQKIPFPTSV